MTDDAHGKTGVERASVPRCPRAWEAEAIADGRLRSVGRASFERHATGCDGCEHARACVEQIDRLARADERP
jgi:hypothetical protein